MNVTTPIEKLTPKDFTSDQEVRWCPGCGDYAILKAIQKTMPDLGVPREDIVFISGIGCSSRFPYYMNTYGFHTIHGRAPAFATGVKLANPDLSVWVITGDGDGLSIGGNHLLHILRRNVNVQILLFNNEIYGLTKGQASPTSRRGTRSPSTPMGSVDDPVSPAAFALGAGARFVARGIDTQQKLLPDLFLRAHAHAGASFIELFQNCIVYNDGVFNEFTEKTVAEDHQIHVAHGKPLRFGKDGNRGLRLKPASLDIEIVTIGENGVTEDDILVHDETNRNLANLLASMQPPDFPMAIGVLYCNPSEPYAPRVNQQIEAAKAKTPAGGLDALLRSGHTWRVSD
ncbi:MAG: 2-oxoacid:ferredoxin oxidoreductase subunit beta [Rhodospirillaceae bacterium]|nr:MAG: 2-oxoacid:ferredoxin oxidoreductase subunit beta [Rhodospirillaceae bacterium]